MIDCDMWESFGVLPQHITEKEIDSLTIKIKLHIEKEKKKISRIIEIWDVINLKKVYFQICLEGNFLQPITCKLFTCIFNDPKTRED